MVCGFPTSLNYGDKSYFRGMLWSVIRQSWKLAFVLLACGLCMTYLISIGRNWSDSAMVKIGTFTTLMWAVLWFGNSYMHELLDRIALWKDEPVKRLIYSVVGMIAFTLGAIYFVVYFSRWVLNFDVSNDLGGTIYSTIIITTIISMFMTGRSFLINWRRAAVDSEKLKKESVKAQYESLKSQVNPHFLFNSLNALTNLVYQDPDKAAKFIKQLSEVYRYVLDTRDKELVDLRQELDFIRSYLFLQQIRFGDKLKVDMNMNGVDGFVAPLALQMLIENAIKHNIISEEQPLTIELHREEDWLVVTNTLQRKKILPEESNGLGLENIRSRYAFLSDKKVEVIEQTEKFVVRLPVISE
jgi:hypothetical protein